MRTVQRAVCRFGSLASVAVLAALSAPACAGSRAGTTPPAAPPAPSASDEEEPPYLGVVQLPVPNLTGDRPTVLSSASCENPLQGIDRNARLGVPPPSSDPLFTGDDGFGFYRVTGSATGPRTATDDAPLEVTLSAPEGVATGEKLGLTVTFADTSRAPLVLIRPIEGTDRHAREPGYELYLRDDATQAVYEFGQRHGGCGNLAPVRADDYTTLLPGKPRDDLADSRITTATIDRPGAYTAWVVYRMCGHIEGFGGGRDFIRRDALRGVHSSNAVRIVVR